MRVTIGVVYVLYNFGGIEQDHNVVRQKTNSVDAELFFGKQDRTGFGHAERRAYDRNVNAAGVRPAGEVFGLAVTGILGNSRTDRFSAWESLLQECFKISRRLGHHFPVKFFQRRSKLLFEVDRLLRMKLWNGGQFASRRLVIANILQDGVSKAHRFISCPVAWLRCFLYQSWKVSLAGGGI